MFQAPRYLVLLFPAALAPLLPGCALFEAHRRQAQLWRLDDTTQVMAEYDVHQSAVSKSPDVNYKRSTLSIRAVADWKEEAALTLEGRDQFGDFQGLEARSDAQHRTIWLVNKIQNRVVAVVVRPSEVGAHQSFEYGPDVGVVLTPVPFDSTQ